MKKALIFLITLSLLALTACSGSGESAPADSGDVAAPSSSDSSAESTAPSDQQQAAPAPDDGVPADGENQDAPSAEMVKKEYYLVSIEPFSEGRAWVEYAANVDFSAGITTSFALIDEEGQILCTSPVAGTPVSGGYTACCNEEKLVIYDKDGNITFQFTNTPEDSFEVRSAAEGKFVVLEHVTGFTGNQYLLYLMDHNGNALTDKFDVTDVVHSVAEYEYLGENIFAYDWSGDHYVLNAATNQFFKADYMPRPFYEGKTIANVGSARSPISLSDLQDESAYLSWRDNRASARGEVMSAGEGIWLCDDGTFYDYDLNPLFGLPDYGENVQVSWDVHPFSGGYAAIQMIGADKLPYMVFIDRTGTPQFEPVCLGKEGDHWALDHTLSHSGRYFFSLGRVSSETGIGCISADGTLTKYDVLDSNHEPTSVDENYLYFSLGNRIIIYKDGTAEGNSYAISLKDGSYLDKAFELVPADGSSVPAGSVSKTYINPSSFDIDGIWKNIGSGSFGQAQPGAIISFNGETCNFFSPRDTYAFYKDGDEFRLDCTSYMSTDTLSFTVKIVDDDHVDIFYGDTIVELERTE